MKRTKLTPKDVTPPMGAYSHGYEIDLGDARWIFVTGQIPIDSEGNLIPGDIEAQTRFVFERVKAILEEGDSSMTDVVKAQIFLTDIGDFKRVSAVRNEYFAESRPTSTLVQVEALVREGAKVEVEVIAISEPR
jgi:2-iminobutanoate/2-iminopropanoate deaminase